MIDLTDGSETLNADPAALQRWTRYAEALPGLVNVAGWALDAVRVGLEPHALLVKEADGLERAAALVSEAPSTSRRERAELVGRLRAIVQRVAILLDDMA